ncbi:MAG: transglutaminase domain protein [Fibrobacteres bacterium]|nr:transglutaminase domain protein [Fibrobacterota bacterium]
MRAEALPVSPVIPSKSPGATSGLPAPSAVLETFDALLEAGRLPEARRLCAGQMLRMFDFIALAQAKVAGLVDSGRSTEETLGGKDDGTWAFVKVSSTTVFKRPFLGQDSIRSVQAVHFYRSKRGWLIAEMEELEGPGSPVSLRTGVPDAAEPSTGTGNLFPVSRLAPGRAGEADRLRYRLRLKNGGSLAESCRLTPDQTLVKAVSPSEWILENRRHAFIRPDPTRSRGSAPAALPPDSLRTYLASNAFLILQDSLLIGTAARVAGRETDPYRIADTTWRWVMEHFRFQFGAVLFGTSEGILRGMTGDCSEAAVLTAALLRARGVPARIALGFASLGRGVFIGHAWCEAWLGGGWVGVDAALREFPAGVERVKLADLDGRADMRIAATNLMMRTISNLEIEIQGAWKDGGSLPLRAYPDNSREAGRFFEEILKGMEGKGEKDF